jgi:methionyl-tRNA formyltransferase
LEAVQEVEDVVVENRTPGKVIFVQEGLPVVVCGQGLVKILAARWVGSGRSILPLAQFRSRFY